MHLVYCKTCKTEHYTTANWRDNECKCPTCGERSRLRYNYVTEKACTSLYIRGMKEKFGKFWRDNG